VDQDSVVILVIQSQNDGGSKLYIVQKIKFS